MSLYLPIQQPKTQKENIVSNSKCISLYSNLYYTYKTLPTNWYSP